ncbi:MAG: rod shape-determining protein MreC [Candidatus Limnocylindrales bacterium]
MFATRTARRRTGAFAALVGVSLVLLLVSDTAPMLALRQDLGTAVTPVQAALTGVTRGLTSVVGAVADVDRLRQENDALRAANQALAEQNAQLQAVKTQDDQLAALLRVRSTLQHQTVAATVVGRGITPTERVVTIDRGTADGLAIGDTVLGQGGAMAGQIYDIGPDYSRVLLLTDSRLTVTGMTQSTRATGEVAGQLGTTLVMANISATATVVPDDLVVTAGIDLGNGFHSPFPKGLLIGRIIDLHTDPNAVVQTAILQPSVDLDNLEFVLVITDYDSSLPGGPAPGASPGASPTAPGSGAVPSPSAVGGNPPIDLPGPSLGP